MKYRVTASWEIDTDSQEKTAEEIKQKLNILDLQLHFAKLKTHKVRLGEFSIDDVFPYITKKDVKREYLVGETNYSVRMNSQRYFLFKQCPKCVACGLLGTRMFLEQDSTEPHPHFNLYGEEDGKFFMLTKDHIHAKSCGGEDHHSNYQTLCVVCNSLKGNANLSLSAIRQLRQIYGDNKQLPKKKLNNLLHEEKEKLAQPWLGPPIYRKKMSMDALITTNDLNVYRINYELFAKAAYDEPEGRQVACLRRGTVLEPLMSVNKQLLCHFSDQEVFLVPQSFVRPAGK